MPSAGRNSITCARRAAFSFRLSDIHANHPALEAVPSDARDDGDFTFVYHLGDLVGYAPWPNEAIALLREGNITGIAGNHDSTVKDGGPRAGYVTLVVNESDIDVELERVVYDVEEAAHAIIASDLPDEFADFCGRGEHRRTVSDA